MTIKLIVGLSNPGIEYSATRHNIGARYVYFLATHLGISFHKESKFYGITSQINLLSNNIYLLIPTIFMNTCGRSVGAIARFYRINPNEILIAHDEMNFSPGIAKFKLGGSHGGHNGVKDICRELGNDSSFYRLRIGIGHPGNKKMVINFVLSKPSLKEEDLINKAIEEAVYCTVLWLTEGLVKARNRLNSFRVK